MKTFLFTVSSLVLLCGCISYDYKGSTSGTASKSVKICTDETLIERKDYALLGTAEVSGNASDISREDLYAKMSKEAKACGADIVLVTAYQVIPVANGKNSGEAAGFDYNESNTSWQQLSRDVDSNYGNIRKSGTDTVPTSYRRVMKGQYLKRKTTSSPAEK